jgi:isoquinoline 1-oxidoreductase alpha subunit
MRLIINGREYDEDVEADMPLLWLLRDVLNMTGTKYGCGVAACGACTVMVDGAAVRSCSAPVGALRDGASVTTIEGLAAEGKLTAVQEAWITYQVPQCGYCQSGQIIAATVLLASNPSPDDEAIDLAMTNICRCGSYPRIRQAIKAAAARQGGL